MNFRLRGCRKSVSKSPRPPLSKGEEEKFPFDKGDLGDFVVTCSPQKATFATPSKAGIYETDNLDSHLREND